MKQTRRPTPTAGADKTNPAANAKNSASGLKPGQFHLDAPFAKSVQLAATFTEWEKSPLDLVKSDDGTWRLVLPLPPGKHHYRFIVDGQWCNDPQAMESLPNPFGSENSVIVVA